MEDLALSVVIPTHNRARLIGRALASVLSEIGKDDEIVVIDDGSTDRTEQVIAGFEDGRIRYIRQAKAGAGVARNRGVREARGGLIAFLDSDDEWLPGKVELQRRFMAARPDVLFSFTDFAREYGGKRHSRALRYWHTDSRDWPEIMGPAAAASSIFEIPPGYADFKVYVGNIYAGEMQTNYLSTITLMVRARDAGDALHFAENVQTFEDWECYGRLARRGLAGLLDYEAAVNHAHPGARLTDADVLTCAESRLAVLQNVWGADPVFLATHGAEYRKLVCEQRLQKLRGLLILGRTREARAEIPVLDGVPISYSIATRLPGALLRPLLSLRRGLLKLLPRLRHDSMRLTRMELET